MEVLEKELSIMSRVVAPEGTVFDSEIAHAILNLGFAKADQDRLSELVEAAQTRELSPEEKSEAESYHRVENWLIRMKSLARRSISDN